MTIPTIAEALNFLGLTLDDIHHYSGENDTLTIVTNDARKIRVTAAQIQDSAAQASEHQLVRELSPVAHARKIRRRKPKE
jgi:hypothetical protein